MISTAEAVVYNFDPETINSETLKDMIIGHVLAAEDDSKYGEDVVGYLFKAYGYALADEASNKEMDAEEFVEKDVAEKIFRKAFVKSMMHHLECDQDYAEEACYFPDCIPYRDGTTYVPSLLRTIGECLGYRTTRQVKAMREYFEAANG